MKNLHWHCLKFEALNTEQLYKILSARMQVFILEQNCIYLDIDGKDQDSYHLFATENNQIIAYARLIPPGISYKEPSIGRVLVLPNYRRTGIGYMLMQKAIAHLQKVYADHEICISAQSYLINFYQSLGFQTEGEAYLEDDIPHIKMRLKS